MESTRYAAWTVLLLLAGAARGAGAPPVIEFDFVVKACAPAASARTRGRYAEYALTAAVAEVRGGRLREAVGAEFSARPLIYVGPIRSRPVGLWVGATLDEAVPRVGQRWTARCAASGDGPVSAARLLSGRGEGCRVAVASVQ